MEQTRRVGAERHRYLYSDADLEECVPRIKDLADTADETLVLFANCYRGYCVRHASQFTNCSRVQVCQ